MTVAATSLEAYRSLDDSGRLQEQEAKLMRLVHRHFPLPSRFTRKELQAATGWTINVIAGRCNGLVRKGFLTEYPQTRDGGHLLSISQSSQPNAAAPADAPLKSAPANEATERVAAAPLAPGASALDIARTRAAQAQANRASMPGVTAFVDELRKVFPDARVTYAAEGERTFGKAGLQGVQASDSSPGMDERTRRRPRRAA